MAQQNINLGSGPNTQTGDNNPVAWAKTQANFTDLYTRTSQLTPVVLGITRAQIASHDMTAFIRFITTDGAPWVPGGSSGPSAIQDSTNAWWQLDTSVDEWQSRWFSGVDPTGVADCHAGMTNAVNAAMLYGVRLRHTPGTYSFASGVSLNMQTTYSVDWVCDDGVYFVAKAGFTNPGSLFLITNGGASSRVHWKGGRYYGNNIASAEPTHNNALLNFSVQSTNTPIESLILEDFYADMGSPTVPGIWLVANGDTSVFIGACQHLTVKNGIIVGSNDCGLYISGGSTGDGTTEVLDSTFIDNLKFVNCIAAISVKRVSHRTHIGRIVLDTCVSGVVVGSSASLGNSTTNNITQDANIQSVISRYCEQPLILRNATNVTVGSAIARYLGTYIGAWAQSTTYGVGAYSVANGNVYYTALGGTSLGSGTGPSGTGSAITDNTVTWAYVGAGSAYSSTSAIATYVQGARRCTVSSSICDSQNPGLGAINVYNVRLQDRTTNSVTVHSTNNIFSSIISNSIYQSYREDDANQDQNLAIIASESSVTSAPLLSGASSVFHRINPSNSYEINAGTVSLGGVYGAEAARIISVASQVLFGQFTGAATGAGSGPGLNFTGSDSNVSGNIVCKGTGVLLLQGSAGNEGLRIAKGVSGGTAVEIDSAAAGSGVTIKARGGNTDEQLILSGKGAGTIKMSSPVNVKTYTVGTLPTGADGDFARVSDANAATFNATVAAGGSIKLLVQYDGSNWKIA